MDIKYAEGETLIKSWDYALSKDGNENKKYNFSVTNKRVIYSAEGKKSLDRREIYVDDVKTLDFSFEKTSGFGTILLLFLGILLSVVIIGIFMIVKAVRRLKEKSFTLEITENGSTSKGILAGASTIFSIKRQRKMKLKVYNDVAIEIINELGATILNAKSGK